jgi:hypothetical protein
MKCFFEGISIVFFYLAVGKGYLLSVVGCLLLVVCCWLSVVGCLLLVVCCCLSVVGCCSFKVWNLGFFDVGILNTCCDYNLLSVVGLGFCFRIRL